MMWTTIDPTRITLAAVNPLRAWVLGNPVVASILIGATLAVVLYVTSGGGMAALIVALVVGVAFTSGAIYGLRRFRPPN
jgi:hypothetical protein